MISGFFFTLGAGLGAVVVAVLGGWALASALSGRRIPWEEFKDVFRFE